MTVLCPLCGEHGLAPCPKEFQQFIAQLRKSAPEGYEPWIFRCKKESKAPATQFGSWKKEKNRITPSEAIEWMEQGGNVGVAGMEHDPLVPVDIDDDDATDPDEDMKDTLLSTTRSRSGNHGFYWEADGEEIPNIPTEEKGEVRAQGQYVLAPGSYVPTDADKVPDGEEDKAGYYTIKEAREPATITLDELPPVFQQKLQQSDQHDNQNTDDSPSVESYDGKSAVFDVSAKDVARKEGASTDPSDRWESAFHGSTTGENMSLSQQGRIQCWRHNVAHGGLQALVALSDYPKGCGRIGTGHNNSNAGPSCIKGDDSAVWHAWKYAKNNGYIPEDDPVPYRALKYICRTRDLCPVTELPDEYDPENGETIPDYAYDAALSSIREHDGLNPGREKTEGFNDAPATDGGATVANSGDTTTQPENGSSPSYNLTGNALMGLLGYDTEENDLGDIPKHQLANGIERLLQSRDDTHIRLLDTVDSKDQPIYAMEDETKVWRNIGERRLGQISRQILGVHNRSGVQNELENALRSNPDGYWLMDRDELGIEVGKLPLKDRVLDLNSRESREARPDDYLQGRLPVGYDPDTTIEGTQFEAFLSQSVKPQDMKKLQEYAGYTLLKNAQPHKKALFLVGPTDSGKGTFLKTLEMMLGEENVASETLYDLVNTRWGTHSIYGKMVNISNEVSPKGINNVGQFKMLTGGEDKVPAEDKGSSKYRFTVTQKFLFATNEFPDVENADEAFYNRLLFAEFPHSVPEEEQKDLLTRFRWESDAILNWMLDGLDRLRANGTFTNERSIEDKKDITEAFGSPIDQFAHNALDVTNISEHVVHKKELYAAFTRYCDYLNVDTPTQTKFTKTLKEKSGITDGQSTRVGDSGDKPDVFKGVKVDKSFLKGIQADTPSHSYGTDDSGQSSLGSH